ncbi:MAG TPA: hypothetical protein VNT23_03755 [Gaiellaceae bacterium]|nr:hypothetical protein [Gaiellaceae bacterium]
MDTSRPIEHRSGRLGPQLHEHRYRLVLLIALVEGILVLTGAIPWWTVLLLAAGAFTAYAVVGRGHGNAVVREGLWIVAVSQLLVVLVPALAAVVTALAVVALVLLAVVALVVLVLDRR